MDSKTYLSQAIDFSVEYGVKALIAIVTLIVGLWLIRRLTRAFNKFLAARQIDESLRPFFISLTDVALKIVLLIVVAGNAGIATTSFIAVFSAVAFSIGLALQGSLGNFASGVLILLFRPYKVGDHITVGDKSGVVKEIQIFNTVLNTPQGKKIIIPNGIITQGAIENITDHIEVRADVKIDLLGKSKIDLIRSVAEEVVRSCKHRLAEKEPFVQIVALPRSAITVEIGCWTTGIYHDDTKYYLYEELKKAFDAVGIEQAQIEN
jgi:small conductance mechanosensitive channel